MNLLNARDKDRQKQWLMKIDTLAVEPTALPVGFFNGVLCDVGFGVGILAGWFGVGILAGGFGVGISAGWFGVGILAGGLLLRYSSKVFLKT